MLYPQISRYVSIFNTTERHRYIKFIEYRKYEDYVIFPFETNEFLYLILGNINLRKKLKTPFCY